MPYNSDSLPLSETFDPFSFGSVASGSLDLSVPAYQKPGLRVSSTRICETVLTFDSTTRTSITGADALIPMQACRGHRFQDPVHTECVLIELVGFSAEPPWPLA